MSKILKSNYVAILSKEKMTEESIIKLSKDMFILGSEQTDSINQVINYMTSNIINENFDWNAGSLLYYANHLDIINIIKQLPLEKIAYLYDSVGIAWLCGELQHKDEIIEIFLRGTIRFSRNSDAWWQAAFSLEKCTSDNAICILKRNLKQYKKLTLDEYLNTIDNKKSIIGILNNSNNTTIKNCIYPYLYEKIKKCTEKELLNILWLLGRLRLINNEVLSIIENTFNGDNEKLLYSLLWALAQDPRESYRKLFIENVNSNFISIRKIAVRGIGQIGRFEDILLLENLLFRENSENVIAEISKAIYAIKNTKIRYRNLIKQRYIVNENGLIGDETDKWYTDPNIYNTFSEAEDVENVCMSLILKQFYETHEKIVNPIDLATGTGKILRLIANTIEYEGTLCGIDISKEMIEYVTKIIDRQKKYVSNIELKCSTIKDFKIENKSNFIISSFGFPSKITSPENCMDELEAVYNMLTEDGAFITIGWDETFNDQLSEFWYRYIPDDIIANDFEEWKKKKKEDIYSARNTNLTWLKKGIILPLQFSNLEDSINVIGHLFGNDAAIETIKKQQLEWEMSFGITYNTKKELKKILNK